MNKKIHRQVEKILSIPRYTCLKIKYPYKVCIIGLQRWEAGVKTVLEGGSLYIGRLCNFRRNTSIRIVGGVLYIGDRVFLNENVSITCMNKITIGNNVKIANNTVIVDHDHDYGNSNHGYLMGSIVIEDNVWIGANCTILRNTYIGKNTVIAAGSVVKGIVPNFSIYGGKIATEIKKIL